MTGLTNTWMGDLGRERFRRRKQLGKPDGHGSDAHVLRAARPGVWATSSAIRAGTRFTVKEIGSSLARLVKRGWVVKRGLAGKVGRYEYSRSERLTSGWH